MSRIGSTVAGKYRLDRLIGAGSIGAVYAAVHLFTEKNVALKLIDPSIAEHEGYSARFLREARAAAAIGHPVICDVIDAGQEPDGSLYLALELLEGRTLEEAIDADELSLDETVDVIIQILEGLAAAHDRGIVHRDVKPENIFLTWDERGELRTKLLDFGVAKNTKGGPAVFSTQQGAILGTPYYMAPEQASGDPVDTRADIWAVGAVLFHAVTGRPPFDESTYNRLIAKLLNQDPPTLSEVRPDLPDWLVTAVDGALQRDADIRWQSARTMAETLRLKGKGALELDWELHEDATVRSESFYDSSSELERPPALRAHVGPQLANILVEGIDLEGGIEVDLDPVEADVGDKMPSFDGGGGPTIRSELPPAYALDAAHARAGGGAPRSRWSAGLVLGVLLGVALTAAVALGAGWFLLRAGS